MTLLHSVFILLKYKYQVFNNVQEVTPEMVIVLYLHFSVCTSFSKPETFSAITNLKQWNLFGSEILKRLDVLLILVCDEYGVGERNTLNNFPL